MSESSSPARTSVLVALVLLFTGCTSEPKSYDDCILKYVKAGMDTAAVAAVMNSCQKKFPAVEVSSKKATSSERSLDASELAALSGRARLSYGNHYEANIYNGNDHLSITHLELLVTTTIGGKQIARVYGVAAAIGPLTADRVGFSIIVGDPGASYDWSIKSARGRPVQ